MNIFDYVLIALKNAYINSSDSNLPSANKISLKNRNKLRSSLFVGHLAQQLRNIYVNENNNYIVLPEQSGRPNSEFGMKELLYDILVCDTESMSGVKHQNIDISLIKKCLWAIESEFSNSTREMIKDFNKLILSSCESKLFVGRTSQNYNNNFFDIFEKAASYGTGTFYIALIPHPNDWEQYDAFYMESEEIENLKLTDFGIETRVFTSIL